MSDTFTWTERGSRTGAKQPHPSARDRWIGRAFWVAWRLLGLLALPLLALHPRARRHVLGLPAPEPGWTWLHGASAGEHVAARALVPLLDSPAWRTSSSWRTPVRGAFPAPLDLPFVFERWLDRARPGRLVLIEAELWPGWLAACRARDIPVTVVNARHSRGTARWRRLGPLWRWLTEDVRFISQEATGDLKLAAAMGEATFQLGRDAFIAASTRPGDEARLLAAWALLPERINRAPRPMLVIAPRHLARVDEVAALLDASGLRWARRTRGFSADVDALLLDTMGELGALFAQARGAFVGGTFDEAIGGHSPAEPFRAGLPVVHGPHTHANPVAWTQGAAFRVSVDEPASLAAAIRTAFAMGPQAFQGNEAAIQCASMLPDSRVPRETPLHPWLSPLVPLVRAVGRRKGSYAGTPERAGVPVISVGALVAGGAGKTPVAAWIAKNVDGAWVVGRGYRREGGGADVRVGLPGEPPERPLGDELEMLRRRGIPVISAPDRVAGAREAARRGARLVVLDDGFQHRRLHREIDIVCIDARWPDGRGPIPVGWRREPWQSVLRARFLWLHNAGPHDPRLGLAPGQQLIRSALRPVGWLRQGQRLSLDAVQGEVEAAAGIARPEGFLSQLVRLNLDVKSWRRVADHRALGALPSGCLVTEKDAARLPEDADVTALLTELVVEGGDDLLDLARSLARGPVCSI